jgi:hypothetical protein
MASDYKIQITECDVPKERHSALEAYRAKRAQWLMWLDEDEDHAIWTAISGMVWTDVSFRTIAQLAKDDETSSLGNPLLAEQLINGHFATQILAIRRLVDCGRGNISIRRLIMDIRSNFKLFTRENYVCYDGLPYDYEVVMHEEIAERAGKGAFWAPTTGPKAWGTSKMAHEQFDKLTGISPDKRSREDRLPLTLMDTIEKWLNESGADDLVDWSHVYLAHAGNLEGRQRIADAVVTTNKINEVMKILARVTEAISSYVLFAGGRINALMPIAQFDQFENLDKPVMQISLKDEAYKIWDDLSSERNNYLESVRTELLKIG